MKSGGCRYCGSIHHSKEYAVTDIFNDTYAIHSCNDCKAKFLFPFPTQIQLSRAYDDSYYGEGEEKFKSSLFEKVLDAFRRKRAKQLAKKLPAKAKILDIGCGNGNFLASMLRYGDFELHGIEMEGNSAKRAAKIKEINLNIGSIEESTYPENSFDAISIFHVFEHLEEAKKTLDIIKKILKPGGYLVLSFPNIDSIQAKRFKGDWLHLDPPRHLLYFAPNHFIALMESNNYSLLKTKYFSTEQNPFGMVQSYLNRWSKKKDLLFESMKGNKDYLKGTKASTLFFHKVFFLFFFPVFICCDIIASLRKRGATVEFWFKK
jgi:2-polyprenyl-3-methyl-5-hydroxy-6-metoxy-1,4-benzoquinol methylase